MIPTSTRPLRMLMSVPVTLAALAFAPHALADAIPPTECASSGVAGQACTTAGDGTQDGVCTSEMCSHIVYLPDGGMSSAESPCLLCEIPDAGPAEDAGPAKDAGPAEDAGPIPSDAGPTPPPPEDAGPATNDAGASPSPSHLASSSSCAVAVVGAGPGPEGPFALFGIALAPIALVLSAVSRGRRRPKV